MIPPGNQPGARPGQQWHRQGPGNNQDDIDRMADIVKDFAKEKVDQAIDDAVVPAVHATRAATVMSAEKSGVAADSSLAEPRCPRRLAEGSRIVADNAEVGAQTLNEHVTPENMQRVAGEAKKAAHVAIDRSVDESAQVSREEFSCVIL